MNAHENQPRFDLDRIRAATAHGSTRFWTSLEELIDENGFRRWLAAEFPAAARSLYVSATTS
jgi:MoCo/4Fe-4S cofactor protein with predicted Tat translocation signal